MNKEKLLLIFIVLGIFIFLAYPVYGLLGTVFGMQYSFIKVNESPNPSAQEMVQGIEGSLMFTVIGISMSVIGLAIACCCIIALIRIPRLTNIVYSEQGEQK